jgi:predicted enzyme related to lactoylglutathione lyase
MQAENNFPKLGPIIIGTSSIEKAKKFYSAVFGITIEHEEPHYVSARGADGTHIELEEDSESRFPRWAEHNVGTYKNSEFLVSDIHAFTERVVQHGGKVISAPTARPWGGFGAEVADLDGNIFLISQR